MKIWANVVKFFDTINLRPKSQRPKCASYTVVSKAVKDQTVLAKLYCFIAIADEFTEYLDVFQSDKPMAPLIYDKLKGVLNKLLANVVRHKVLVSCNNLQSFSEINCSDEKNLKAAKDMDICFSADVSLKKAGVSTEEKLEFKCQLRKFYIYAFKKLVERCSLRFSVVGYLDGLNPKTIASRSIATLKKKMSGLLSELEKCKYFTLSECDIILQQYLSFITVTKDESLDLFSNFDLRSDRLDSFFMKTAKPDKYPKIWELLRIVFILSHGQAAVERGFSVNKDVLKTNMKERTIVNHRIVYEGIKVSCVYIISFCVLYVNSLYIYIYIYINIYIFSLENISISGKE